MNLLASFALTAIILFAVPVLAQDGTDMKNGGNMGGPSSDTNMGILIQKIKADKKLLVAGNMDLNDAEGKKFWPLYDEYQKELEQVNHRLGKTIKEYAEAFNKGPVKDDQAKKLMNEALAVEDAEVKLKRTYAEKIGKVLPAAKTARYLQIETKIRSVLKAQLAQEIPLVY
ncbi:MAG TPA: hypothetical protein VJ746_05330 [Nitrospira sp.]|nr:hypothetical protein [Nitrospira sp.]